MDSENLIYELCQASFHGNIDEVKKYLSMGADINGLNPGTMTPLMCAIENDNYEVVKYLLDNGADINKIGRGWTALHNAVEVSIDTYHQEDYPDHGPNTKMVKMLLKYKPNINKKDVTGKTPLDYAEHDLIKELLIKAGAKRERDI